MSREKADLAVYMDVLLEVVVELMLVEEDLVAKVESIEEIEIIKTIREMVLEVVDEILVGELDAMVEVISKEDKNTKNKNTLEKVISGFENFGRSIKHGITSRDYWVDTLTSYVYFAPLMTVNERYVQEFLYNDGSTWDEIGMARAAGLGVGMCLGRPLSKLRDYWAKNVFNVNGDCSKLRKHGADFTFALVGIPLGYALSLALAGENIEEMKQIIPMGSAINLGIALFYGKFLDSSREIFGTTPEYLKKDVSESQ
jgi:hypothetical protein